MSCACQCPAPSWVSPALTWTRICNPQRTAEIMTQAQTCLPCGACLYAALGTSQHENEARLSSQGDRSCNQDTHQPRQGALETAVSLDRQLSTSEPSQNKQENKQKQTAEPDLQHQPHNQNINTWLLLSKPLHFGADLCTENANRYDPTPASSDAHHFSLFQFLHSLKHSAQSATILAVTVCPLTGVLIVMLLSGLSRAQFSVAKKFCQISK